MIKVKKFLSLILCAILCFSLSIAVFAAESNPTVKVSSVTAMPGDSVVINIEISNNPGIMAMAFCITYDSDALVYKNYEKGYLSSYTVKDHSDKGHVSFVNVENKDINTNGKIISLIFDVKNDAKPGKHPITIANSNRDKYGTKLHNIFSNSNQQFIVPSAVSGGVTVQETCENAGHKYGSWETITSADCTHTGEKTHTCVRCEYTEKVEIPFTHDFEAEWTVDKAATPEEDGIMSRHCTKCDEVTDKITFSYEEIGGDEEDTSSDDVSGDISSDNDSSGEISSNESNTTESNSSNDILDGNASNTSDQTTTNEKPIINNVVGEKVPLQEVEKLEDYQQNIKPDFENNSSNEEITSDEIDSSSTGSDNSNITAGVTQNNDNAVSQNDEPSFFATPTGIIMIVICSLLSVGIIAFGILLIVRNKKSNK